MNVIERFNALAADHRWAEALPVIEEIIARSPSIDTSWFNYGVCLDGLGRHSEAAEAFIKAQEFNPLDSGIHYRIFRSFYLAGDYKQFLEFASYACEISDQTIHLLLQDEDFKKLFERDEFREFKRKQSDHEQA
jgi:tetratricopeptide (TPR) repeat protein